MSNLILVIGQTSSGKSPFVKNMIKGKNCLVFDYQNEYGETNKYGQPNIDVLPEDVTLARSKIFCNAEMFMEIIKRKRNTNIVWEEATGFFAGRIGKSLTQLILSKAHSGNNFIFIFHSVQRVPKAIVEFTNTVVLFQTGDQLKDIERKFPKAVRAAYDLRSKPAQGKHYVINIM